MSRKIKKSPRVQGSFNRLSKNVSMKLGITYKDAKHIVKAVLDALYEEIIGNRIFSLKGYFSSEKVELKGRRYNVLGNSVVETPDRLTVKLKPSRRMLQDIRES